MLYNNNMQEHSHTAPSTPEAARRKGYRVVFLLAFTAAVLFEALLFLHTQAREILSLLEDDFRVVVLLKDGGRKERDALWESIRALQGVRSAVFISKDERLARMREDDPELIKGGAVAGAEPAARLLRDSRGPGGDELAQFLDRAALGDERSGGGALQAA